MTTPTEELEPNELDLEQQFGQGAPRELLGVQYGAADSADFSEGTWSFKMHGAWQVAAGEFAIMPRAAYVALQAIAEPHTVRTDWQPINTLDKAEDEVWLLKGGNVIDGPRHPETDDADLYSHWANCRPPKLLKAAPIWDGKGLPPIGCDVLIRHGRDDADHVCTVTGYEAWPSLDKNPFNSRVQVHLVYKGTDTKNCRALCDLWPLEAVTGVRRPSPPQSGAGQAEGALALLLSAISGLEAERDMGWSPDADLHLSRVRAAGNMLAADSAPHADQPDLLLTFSLAYMDGVMEHEQPEIYEHWQRVRAAASPQAKEQPTGRVDCGECPRISTGCENVCDKAHTSRREQS